MVKNILLIENGIFLLFHQKPNCPKMTRPKKIPQKNFRNIHKSDSKLIKPKKKSGLKRMDIDEPTYKLGDLVACYGDAERHNIVIGWVEDVQAYGKFGHMYKVRWSDRLNNEAAMEINEEDMGELVQLLEKVKSSWK
jgi:hypothetical protein